MEPSARLDGTDWEILQMLSQDARMPTANMARKLGISREVAKYRLARMKAEGTILAFLVRPDTSKLGYPIWGYMHVKFKDLTAKRENELIEYAKREPLVAFAYSNLGSWDFGIEFMAHDPRHFYDLQRRIVEKFSNIIKDYETGSFIDVYKMNYVPYHASLKNVQPIVNGNPKKKRAPRHATPAGGR